MVLLMWMGMVLPAATKLLGELGEWAGQDSRGFVDNGSYGTMTPTIGWKVAWNGVTSISAKTNVLTLTSIYTGPFRIYQAVVGDEVFAKATAIARREWQGRTISAVDVAPDDGAHGEHVRFVQRVSMNPTMQRWREAISGHWRIALVFVGIFAVPAWIEASLVLGQGGWVSVTAVILATWFTIMPLVWPIAILWLRARAMQKQTMVAEVDGDGVCIKRGALSQWVKWEAVSSITEESWGFHIRCNGLTGVGLYTEALGPEELQRLRQLIADAAEHHAGMGTGKPITLITPCGAGRRGVR